MGSLAVLAAAIVVAVQHVSTPQHIKIGTIMLAKIQMKMRTTIRVIALGPLISASNDEGLEVVSNQLSLFGSSEAL